MQVPLAWAINPNNRKPQSLALVYGVLAATISGLSLQTLAGTAEFRELHDGPAWILTYTPSGRLYSAGWDGTIREWATGVQSRITMTIHGHRIVAMSFCLDSGFLVAASSDDWLHRFDLQSGKLLGSLKPRRKIGLRALALSEDCSQLYSGASDETVREWRMSDGEQIGKERDMDSGAVRFILRRPTDSRQFAIGTKRGAMIWTPPPDSTERKLLRQNASNRVVSMVWRRDGRVLAVAYADRAIALWDPDTGK